MAGYIMRFGWLAILAATAAVPAHAQRRESYFSRQQSIQQQYSGPNYDFTGQSGYGVPAYPYGYPPPYAYAPALPPYAYAPPPPRYYYRPPPRYYYPPPYGY